MALAGLLGFAAPVAAEPMVMHIPGQLTGPGTAPLTTPVTVTFRLFEAAIGGSLIHEETLGVTPDERGVFLAEFGGGGLDSSMLTEGAPLFIEVTVSTETLTPRIPVQWTGHAGWAAEARGAERALAADSVAWDDVRNVPPFPTYTAGAGLTRSGQVFAVDFGLDRECGTGELAFGRDRFGNPLCDTTGDRKSVV